MNDLFDKVIGKEANDFHRFIVPEQIAKKRKELESRSRLYVRIGTRDAVLKYEGKMRKQRKREAEERQRQFEQTIRYVSWV